MHQSAPRTHLRNCHPWKGTASSGPRHCCALWGPGAASCHPLELQDYAIQYQNFTNPRFFCINVVCMYANDAYGKSITAFRHAMRLCFVSTCMRRQGDTARTGQLGSQVLDPHDNDVFSVQYSVSCDICGVVGASPSQLCAYLPVTQTDQLKMPMLRPAMKASFGLLLSCEATLACRHDLDLVN